MDSIGNQCTNLYAAYQEVTLPVTCDWACMHSAFLAVQCWWITVITHKASRKTTENHMHI